MQTPLTFCLGTGNKQGNREPCFPDLPGPSFHMASDECLLLSGLCFLPGDEDAVLGDMCSPPRPLCGLTLMRGARWAWRRRPLGSLAFAGALETGCQLDPFRGA